VVHLRPGHGGGSLFSECPSLLQQHCRRPKIALRRGQLAADTECVHTVG
jgi:hypothetical protein